MHKTSSETEWWVGIPDDMMASYPALLQRFQEVIAHYTLED